MTSQPNRPPQRITLRDIKHFIVAMRTELRMASIQRIKKFDARIMLESENGDIVQLHMTGRPPYDVTRVAYNNTVIATYRNSPTGLDTEVTGDEEVDPG